MSKTLEAQAIHRMIDEGSPSSLDRSIPDLFRFDPRRMMRDLSSGREILIRCSGNSLSPLIRYGELVRIEPMADPERQKAVQVGDIVAALMPEGKLYCHIVQSISEGENDRNYTIINNRGFVNGVTSRIFGRITEVLDPVTFEGIVIGELKAKSGWTMPDLLK